MTYRACAAAAILALTLVACAGDVSAPSAGTGGARSDGGTGGTGAGGNAGEGGGGGAAGAGGGSAGSGGAAGSGGTGGTGGSGGSVGTGGTGGVLMGDCYTNSLCTKCPDQFLCDSEDDCFTGWTCVDSGCDDEGGSSIGQCQPSPGGACNTSVDCLEEYECLTVPLQGKRCVKTTPGCNTSFDCVMGFSCESGTCVDRRVPCIVDDDCPMSHSCESPTQSNRFCVRIHQTCFEEFDCGVLAPYCVDIDDDGRKECAGSPIPSDPNTPACTNAACTSPSAPVCEVSLVGSITNCGQYGLCKSGSDCAAGFACVGLWSDGRKECVPSGGSCDHITDCPLNEVCASPRTGGAPDCQAGAAN